MNIDFKEIELKVMQLQFDRNAQIEFLSDVRTRLEDGVSAIQIFKELAKTAKKGTPVKFISENLMQRVARGENIGEGFRGWYPAEAVEVIIAASASTRLSDALKEVEEELKVGATSVNQIFTAPIYPLVIVMAMLGVLISMSGKEGFFTLVAEMVPVARWPTGPYMAKVVGEFVSNWWMLVAIVIAGISVGFYWMLRNYLEPFTIGNTQILPARTEIDNFFGFSLYRRLQALRAVRSLRLLLQGGMPMKKALQVIEKSSGKYVANHMKKARRLLDTGEQNVADILNTGLLDADIRQRLHLLAGKADVTDALTRVSNALQDRVARSAKLTARTEVTIAWVLVGVFGVLVIKGMYGLNGLLQTIH